LAEPKYAIDPSSQRFGIDRIESVELAFRRTPDFCVIIPLQFAKNFPRRHRRRNIRVFVVGRVSFRLNTIVGIGVRRGDALFRILKMCKEQRM
jgi:hypothetical protein